MGATTHPPSASLEQDLARWFNGDPALLASPYTMYHGLREAGPVYRFGSMVLVSRFADVKEVMRDGEGFSMRAKAGEGTQEQEERARRARELTPEQVATVDEILAFQGLVMSRNDGETHARLRGVAHRALTPRAVAEAEQTVHTVLDELLAARPREDVIDLREIAFRLPVTVITTMLGVPREDMRLITGWTNAISRTSDPAAVQSSAATIARYRGYGDQLADRYRTEGVQAPRLAAAMFAARTEDRLNGDELSAMLLNLVFAGHETTTNLISLGLYELLRRPGQWRLLTEDPSRSAQAVGELLRFVSPVQSMIRLAVADVEIGGETIRAGQTVIPMIAAANRDTEVFETPDELDIVNPDRINHLAFGHGPHFCIGASLARLEAGIALGELARRFPEMELAGDIVWAGDHVVRKLEALPVRLGRDHAG
jgi:cytochrome P450